MIKDTKTSDVYEISSLTIRHMSVCVGSSFWDSRHFLCKIVMRQTN